MKIRIIVSICFLIIGCSSNKVEDNIGIKKIIDQLEVSKKITEVQIDTVGNILDTITIEYLKFDNRGRKRFKKREFWYEDREFYFIDYFDANEDLFFREVFDKYGELYSNFEAFFNRKGEIIKAVQVDKEGETVDTIFMDYFREYYLNGSVKKLMIKTSHEEIGESMSKVTYDEQGNPIFELMTMNGDTFSIQDWEYSDTILQKSIYMNYQVDTSKSIYYFVEGKQLIKEEEFEYKDREYVKSKEINHKYDKSGDRIETTKINLRTNDFKHIKYIIEE